jgi:hypothetical protein
MILLENPAQGNPRVKFAGNIHRKSGICHLKTYLYLFG